MKFLCVSCDEAMKLTDAAPPEQGSISAIFGCPTCGHQIAMLTNPYETQLVQSLGVKIGPATSGQPTQAPPAPAMAAAPTAAAPTAAAPAPMAATPAPGGVAAEAAAGGCPFSGMLAEMEARKPEAIQWTAEALGRLENIPEFVRPMAKQGIEHYAKTHGHTTVDDAVMEEARGQFGM